MKKVIKLNESQLKSLILSESMGVPTEALKTATNIVASIIDELESIEESVEEASYNCDEDYDEDWTDYFEYTVHADDYTIELFGQNYNINGNTKANTDGEGTIEVNYSPIHDIVVRTKETCAEIENIDDDEREGLIFNTIGDRVYNYLYPIIIHELTHDANKGGTNLDCHFIGSCHRLNADDVRNVLYLFSDSEMNSRIASAAGIMYSTLHDLMMDSTDVFSDGKEFNDFVEEYIINDIDGEKELRVREMRTMLSLINDDTTERGYIKRIKSENMKPYSLAYDLFRNDSRLKNNRTLKMLFENNYPTAVRYVVSFYTKLLDRFIKKIKRACYYAYLHNINELKENEENSIN